MLAVRQALLQPRGPSPLCREANGTGIHAQSWKSSFLAGDNCRRNGPGDSATGVLDFARIVGAPSEIVASANDSEIRRRARRYVQQTEHRHAGGSADVDAPVDDGRCDELVAAAE